MAFFILSIATGIFEMFYVTNRIDELNEEIVSADNLVKSENYDGAKDVLAAAESKWQKNLSIFDILLIHDYVDEISVNLSAMRSYVATQSNDNYLAESAGIKKHAEKLGRRVQTNSSPSSVKLVIIPPRSGVMVRAVFASGSVMTYCS